MLKLIEGLYAGTASPAQGGGGGGGSSSYSDLSNKPKINNVTLSGNNSSAELGLTGDVQVNGTSILENGTANLTSTNMASVVRGVRAAYTEITASSTSYTLTSNATYGHAPTAATTYTLPTVVEGEDNWTKLFLDCTNTASIAFQTSDSTTITPVGSPTIETGKKYIFVCQYDNLATTWKVFLVDATV